MNSSNFDWDSAKDLVNQQKYDVSFSLAQFVFADPQRVIARDLEHSGNEARFTASEKSVPGS